VTGKAARSGEVDLNHINYSLCSSIFYFRFKGVAMPESPKVNG
jgi:hypothetical protein